VYEAVLHDSRLYELLFQFDRDLAQTARKSPCRFCGGRLHSADYLRSPRGVPEGVDLGPGYPVHFSFCCSTDGCRRRHNPPSVRFQGRRVYLGVMVVLLTVMRQGPTPRSLTSLRTLFGVDRRTLARWRLWWQTLFAQGRFWQATKARFIPPVAQEGLPGSLLIRFQGDTLLEQIVLLLKFLSPSSQAA
jgi:hypothetical protein